MLIAFKKFTVEDVPLYYIWAEKEHVKNVWFLDGYQPKEYILQKIAGNGIEHPFVILVNESPIGHIQFWDIHARDLIEKNIKDYFTGSLEGTFGIDLFIGQLDYLNKGYGTKILSQFAKLLFDEYHAKKLVMDPKSENLQAIKCYSKAGFTLSRIEIDLSGESISIMEMVKP